MPGLIIVHTGNGKGKTTAALGLALRAWGNGLRILILQFIKGNWSYGELKALDVLNSIDGRIEVKQGGIGFTKKGSKSKYEHTAVAQNLLCSAEEAIISEKWDMVILDEINYACAFGLISEVDILKLINIKPNHLHLVLTGRNATPNVINIADLVTEMLEIKHPFTNKGIKAQKGIEF